MQLLHPRDIKLLKTKKGRDETGLFIIEGEKFVAEVPPEFILQYVYSESFAKANEIAEPNIVLRDSLFATLADTKNPQGIMAVCRQNTTQLRDLPKSGFFLLGENLNDPGNIGTLIRTAAAAGATAVILTEGSADVHNPKVLRASAGAAFRLPIVQNITLQNAAEYLNINIYAAHPRGQITPYQLDLSGDFCVLVGNESHGISAAAEVLATNLVTIPMKNATESLNASVAGSILLYEAVRQRMCL